jgi:phage regulator Rha-like protein
MTPTKPLEALIHMVRGQKVMLDADLASLYGVETKQINRAVKRNANRFPATFMFQLTRDEFLRCQSGTSNDGGRGGRRYLPYAFTEHGVVMLSSVLNSDRAVEMSILVVNAFVRMRELIASNKDLATRVEKLEQTQDRTASVIEILVEDIDRIGSALKQMQTLPPPSPLKKLKIGFRH